MFNKNIKYLLFVFLIVSPVFFIDNDFLQADQIQGIPKTFSTTNLEAKSDPSLGRLYHKWSSQGTSYEGYRYFYNRINNKKYFLMVEYIRATSLDPKDIHSELICSIMKSTLENGPVSTKDLIVLTSRNDKFDSKDYEIIFNGLEEKYGGRYCKFSTEKLGKLKRVEWLDEVTGFEIKKLELKETGLPSFFVFYDELKTNKAMSQPKGIKEMKKNILTKIDGFRPIFDELLNDKKESAHVLEDLRMYISSGK